MESIKDRSTLNWTTDDRRRKSGPRSVTLMALFLVLGLISVSGFAQQIGTQMSNRSTNSLGAAFISDNNGGHWWVSDQQLGICELVPQNLPNQAPFLLNFCNATAISGGQIVVGNPSPTLALPANAKFVYVSDFSAAGITVVRFVFSPSANGGNGGFTGSTLFNVQNVNGQINKGVVRGGSPAGLALLPHNGPAANGGTQDLYVGYMKSQDIMRIAGVENVGLIDRNPAVELVGATSDGSAGQNLLAFGNDLYISENGGTGFSKIADPSGIVRTPCTSAAPCTAITVSPEPSVFPGGLATDWIPGTPTAGKSIFVADTPRAAASHRVLKFDPSTGAISTYSVDINPAYNAPGLNGAPTFFTSYISPRSLGYNPATGDLLVVDDPQGAEIAPIFQQGHAWLVVPPGTNPPSVTSVSPTTGSTLGGDLITVSGFNLAIYNSITGAVITNPTISFGPNVGLSVSCAPAPAPPTPPVPSTCTVTSPAGFGVVDVRVATNGQSSGAVPADLFTYVAPPSTAITVATVAPNSGATIGDTEVTVTGQNLATYDPNTGAVTSVATFNFGAATAQTATCQPSAVPVPVPVNSVCTVTSPAHAAGTVDIQASLTDANGVVQTSGVVPGDQFTYIQAVASLYAWGITAPKGGATFIPGDLGGHWWSSDHAQGLCRQDLFSSAVAPYAIAGNTLHAINFSACGDDIIGSAGQAAYDPRIVPGSVNLHYVYVPDNAVKSTTMWRLTFDPTTETMVADPFGGAIATAMATLEDIRTLKPNTVALGPDNNLYIADLVEKNVRRLSTEQDPRDQRISIVAVTGDGRGSNGTGGFIGNYFYVPGNRASQFFDITQCPLPGGAPCGMASVPAPSLVFIAGTITDSIHKMVYLANSPGGAPASILRYDASKDVYVPFAEGTYAPDVNGVVVCTLCTTGPIAKTFITGGLLPALGTPNGTVTAALTLIRPWDQNFHPSAGVPAGSPVPTGFSFAFGLGTNAAGDLVITEDPSAGARSGRGTMWLVPFVN